MTEPFVIFQSFTDIQLAKELIEGLKKQGIPFQMEDTSSPIDPVIIGSPLEADIRVKLRPQDFAKAHALLEEQYKEQLHLVPKDYYLFEFTDKELLEIIEKPDEWGHFDYLLAQKILKQKGIDMHPEKLEHLKLQRIGQMSRPEEIGKSWIILGYFLSVFFSPVGIFYGYVIATFKKTLPNGQRIYTYTRSNRVHGRNILVISSVLTTLLLLLKIFAAR